LGIFFHDGLYHRASDGPAMEQIFGSNLDGIFVIDDSDFSGMGRKALA